MTSRWKNPQRMAWCVAVCAALVCLVPSGCVHRQLLITTEPMGAIVQVNGQTVGASPVDYPFTYYGTYRITVMKDGFETEVVDQPVAAPWYEWFPLDFVSENLIPWNIRDVRPAHIPMRPLQIAPPEAVLNRSEQFRAKGRMTGVPLPGEGVVPGQPPPGFGQPIPAMPQGEMLQPPTPIPPNG